MSLSALHAGQPSTTWRGTCKPLSRLLSHAQVTQLGIQPVTDLRGMHRPDINQGNDLIIRNGDFVVENGDFALAPHVEANIGLYYVIAQRNVCDAVAHNQQLRPMIQAIHHAAHANLSYQLSDWLQQWTTPAVTFAALCAEALINYYGANRLAPEQWARYVTGEERKTSTIKKFKELPRLVRDDGTLKVPDGLLAALEQLFSIRNRAAHYKTRLVPQQTPSPEHHITVQDCRAALETVRQAAAHLKGVDAGFDFNIDEHLNDERYTTDFADNILRYAAFCGLAPNQ